MVEADFQRFYGIDLRLEVRRAAVRRLKALVFGLPPEAACWRQQTLLLERMDDWFRTYVEWRGGARVSLPPPVEDVLVDRGEAHRQPTPKKRKASLQEAIAWFGGHGFNLN